MAVAPRSPRLRMPIRHTQPTREMPLRPVYESPLAPAGPRILLLSYHYPPGHGTGALRWQKLVRHAAARGWSFDVVTVHPASLSSADETRLHELPAGTRVFGARLPPARRSRLRSLAARVLRRLRLRRLSPSASLAAVPKAAAVDMDLVFREETRWNLGRPGGWLRALHAAEFFSDEWRWAREAARLGTRLAAGTRYAAVVSCGPPHMVHVAARRVSRRAGIPMVMDMRDPWSLVPGLYSDVASPLWYNLAAWFERASVTQSSLVVTNTEPHRQALGNRLPAQRERMVAVHNGCDDEPIPARGSVARFTMAYAGNVYIDRDPRPLFRAAAAVIREFGLSPDRFGIDFMGNVSSFGGQPLTALAEAEGVGKYLALHPRRPRAEALAFLGGASLLISLPQEVDVAIPSKIFEYMQFDAWLLVLARRGSATELLLRDTEADVVEPEDTEGLARVLRRRFEQFAAGERPVRLNVDGRFGRTRQAEHLFDSMAARIPSLRAPAASTTEAGDPASVREYFDRNVEEWDEERYRSPTYVGRGALALRWLGPARGTSRVLDMGCGTGHQSLGAVRQGHMVVSMDFSFEMARATRQRLLREAPHHPPRVVVADALHPPFREGSFDAVMALGLVGFLPDRRRLLRGIRSLIRPGGELICDVGVPEERVLFHALNRRTIDLAREIRRRLWGEAGEKRGAPEPPSFYAQSFHKHGPEEFESLLRDAGMNPRAGGGAGFGEVRFLGRTFLPWRVETLLTRLLNTLSRHRFARPLARRALIYVTRSVRAEVRPVADTVLFVANFSSDTGYAWKTITEVFEGVARRHTVTGGRACVAYPQLRGTPGRASDRILEPLHFDYSETCSPLGLVRFLRLLRHEQVNTLYLTDRSTWDWRYPLFRIAGVKYIVVHDRTSGARASRSALTAAVKRWVHLLPGIAADRFIGVSEFVTQRLREVNGTPAARTSCVYNGIDLARFAEPEPGALHALLGLSPSLPIAFCSGRAQSYKGIQVVIEAAAQLAERGATDAAFVYCGDGPGLADLRKTAERLGARNFYFLGRRDDVARLLGSATVAVVPSLWAEAFGLTVAEAMAAGVPVIASRIGGIPELVDDGRTGVLVPPGDPEALCTAILGLLKDPSRRRRMAEAARTAARERFDIERTAEQIHRVLHFGRPAASSAITVSLSHAD